MKQDSEQITLLLTPEQQAIIKIGAELSDLSIEQFLVKTARKKARSLIMSRVEELAVTDWETVYAATQ